MKINLIRHGATAGNLEKRYIGRTNEPLCPEGISDLKASYLPSPGTLICSPMKRCLETGRILYPDVQPLIFPELRECDFGSFEGKNYMELTGDPYYQKWIDSGGALPFPGGESPAEFRTRCCSGVLRAVAENPSAESLTFIVHGGTIMAVMERFAVPRRGYYDWQCANGKGYSAEYSNKKLTSVMEIK